MNTIEAPRTYRVTTLAGIGLAAWAAVCPVAWGGPPADPQVLEAFEEWKAARREAYQAMVVERAAELAKFEQRFAAFERSRRAAVAAYRERVSRHWSDPELGDPHKWVEFVEGDREKRVVDFEAGEIRIHSLVEKSDTEIARSVHALVNESIDAALAAGPPTGGPEPDAAQYRAQPIGAGQPGVGLVDDASAGAMSWKAQQGEGDRAVRPSLAGERHEYVVRIRPPGGLVPAGARRFAGLAEANARRWGVSKALLLAIMHTESSFNPLATSHVPAYGLMQIVPRYAGREVTQRFWGKTVLLGPSYLYEPENNVAIGAAYLNILWNDYFGEVKDARSRLYCVIAAYNTGPSNVARALTGGRDLGLAVKRANAMPEREVFLELKRRLPYEETRVYLQRVHERLAIYERA